MEMSNGRVSLPDSMIDPLVLLSFPYSTAKKHVVESLQLRSGKLAFTLCPR